MNVTADIIQGIAQELPVMRSRVALTLVLLCAAAVALSGLIPGIGGPEKAGAGIILLISAALIPPTLSRSSQRIASLTRQLEPPQHQTDTQTARASEFCRAFVTISVWPSRLPWANRSGFMPPNHAVRRILPDSARKSYAIFGRNPVSEPLNTDGQPGRIRWQARCV